MKKTLSRLAFSLLILSPACSLLAQDATRCATVEYTLEKKNRFPEMQPAEQAMSRLVMEKMQQSAHQKYEQNTVATVITIPVVVHVLYNTSAQNVSDARIHSQIDALNRDFSKTNSDAGLVPSVWQPLAANTQLQFCLASRKPNGDWTNGIERRQTSMTAFTTGGIDSVKFYNLGGLDGWDYTEYLNIWVINFANGVLGVTQMPLTGPASTDGMAIHYNAFGTILPLLSHYTKGRTATHEVGHWLGLYHIWGDDNGYCFGTDSVSDTPNQTTAHYTCPSFPAVDSCSPVSPGTMFMNYMDYSWDNCMYMFTLEQAQRMNTVLTTMRNSIINSVGCMPAIGIEETALGQFINCYPNPSDQWLSMDLDFPVAQHTEATLYDAMGRLLFSEEYKQVMKREVMLPVQDYPNGIYFLRITTESGSVSKRILISHNTN